MYCNHFFLDLGGPIDWVLLVILFSILNSIFSSVNFSKTGSSSDFVFGFFQPSALSSPGVIGIGALW